mmetsp:Transcript_20273/g.36803  ORF Transcript_20273/g.36803 Transcript_20273/m.36803 type:complete len:567 (-) Transcript_20273:106-1806(-)
MRATGSPPPPTTAAATTGVPAPAAPGVFVETVTAGTHWAPHAALPVGTVAAAAPHVVARTPSACIPFEPQASASPRVLSPVQAYPSRQVTVNFPESPPAPVPVTVAWDTKAVPSPPAGPPPHQLAAAAPTPMNQIAAAIAQGCKIPVVRCESNSRHCGTPPQLAPGAGTFAVPVTQKPAPEQQPLLSELRKQVDDLRFDLTGIRAELEEELRRRQAAEAAKLAADAQARGLRDTMTQLCEELVEREREADRLRSELQEAQLLTRQPAMCKVGDTGSDIVSLNSSAHGRLARARSMNGATGRDRAPSTRAASSGSNRGRPEPVSSGKESGKDATASRTSLASSRASSLSRSNPDTTCTRQSMTPVDKRGLSLESSRRAHPNLSEDRWDSRKASVASEALPRRQRPSQVQKAAGGQSVEVGEPAVREMTRSTSSKNTSTGRAAGSQLSQSLDRIPSHSRQDTRLGTAPLSPWSTLRAVNGHEPVAARGQRLDAATGGTPNGWAAAGRRGCAGGATGPPQPQFVDAAAVAKDGQVWVRPSRRNSQSGDWSPPRPSAYRATRSGPNGNKP